MTYPDRELGRPVWSPPALALWLAVVFFLIAIGIAMWILDRPETCIAGQIADSTGQTLLPTVCE